MKASGGGASVVREGGGRWATLFHASGASKSSSAQRHFEAGSCSLGHGKCSASHQWPSSWGQSESIEITKTIAVHLDKRQDGTRGLSTSMAGMALSWRWQLRWLLLSEATLYAYLGNL